MNHIIDDLSDALTQIKDAKLLFWDDVFLKDFLEKDCIYFLFLNNKIIYIGQTNSLMKRIHQHRISSKNRLKTFNGLSYIFVSKEIKDELENILIDIFRPELNIRRENWLCKKMSEYMNESRMSFQNRYGNNYNLTIETAIEIIKIGIDAWVREKKP